MLKFEGKYRGIIIQNNDPAHSGRVKVFVPGINLHQTKNWNQKKEEDQIFKVIGQNTNSSITKEILNTQKDKLFWAEVLLPIIGMSSMGYYHAPSDYFYIGNDSDYLFQNSNKDFFAFQQDAIQASLRLSVGIQNPNYGTVPRTSLSLNFPQIGAKYCIPKKCDDSSDEVKNIWSKSNNYISPITNSLPKVYKNKTVDLDKKIYKIPLSQKNIKDIEDINYSVIAVELDVVDPDIFLNNTKIPANSPIYNTNCYVSPPNETSTTYEPPIQYLSSSGVPAKSYSNLPVGLTINGKKSLNNRFQLSKWSSDEITYKDGDLTVVVYTKKVNAITILHNNIPFDVQKIKALQPFFNYKKKIIMPRAPRPSGQKMISRGGGGGEIFSNIISTLLPLYMRIDCHIGGANNESRYTINRGRTPLNDPNNTKGCNVINNVGQVYRGPMRAADYNNNWKGVISIPAVGAHVWVIFENGDSNFPIIIGTFTDQNSYKNIYDVKTPQESETAPEIVSPPEDSISENSSVPVEEPIIEETVGGLPLTLENIQNAPASSPDIFATPFPVYSDPVDPALEIPEPIQLDENILIPETTYSKPFIPYESEPLYIPEDTGEYVLTQDGLRLITQNGDYIVLQEGNI